MRKNEYRNYYLSMNINSLWLIKDTAFFFVISVHTTTFKGDINCRIKNNLIKTKQKKYFIKLIHVSYALKVLFV